MIDNFFFKINFVLLSGNIFGSVKAGKMIAVTELQRLNELLLVS